MNQNYLNAIHELGAVNSKIDRLLNAAISAKTFEDIQACRILEDLSGKIESAVSSLKYYSKPIVVGYLIQLTNDRFGLFETNGEMVCDFTCGSPIEVYSTKEGEWYSGRVEYSDKIGGYYFYCNHLDHPKLVNGMRARIRKEAAY